MGNENNKTIEEELRKENEVMNEETFKTKEDLEIEAEVENDLEEAKKEIAKKKLIKGGIILGCTVVAGGIGYAIVKSFKKRSENNDKEVDKISTADNVSDSELAEVFDI